MKRKPRAERGVSVFPHDSGVAVRVLEFLRSNRKPPAPQARNASLATWRRRAQRAEAECRRLQGLLDSLVIAIEAGR